MRNDLTRFSPLPHPPYQEKFMVNNQQEEMFVGCLEEFISTLLLLDVKSVKRGGKLRREKLKALNHFGPVIVSPLSTQHTAECYSVTDDEERLSRFANCGR